MPLPVANWLRSVPLELSSAHMLARGTMSSRFSWTEQWTLIWSAHERWMCWEIGWRPLRSVGHELPPKSPGLPDEGPKLWEIVLRILPSRQVSLCSTKGSSI
eukprot:gnl/TRDRNA2_/TRDRNA2_146254_c0_seq1.p2 gnl/TRDRNA2_/TRDRNA2_146254_c0~~gnl/TRDRNA2_/TRDRNA2_146254_c0_seq1.p2  ORF type:complete len:102 (-),score=6.32 gnl/TRDRNA2_/TRDRNA2_146254_c0_seq1:333-638(-)